MAKKQNARDEKWLQRGFKYWGTGEYEYGRLSDGSPDMHEIDVLDLLDTNDHKFYFSDAKIRKGEPIPVGSVINRHLWNSLKQLNNEPVF